MAKNDRLLKVAKKASVETAPERKLTKLESVILGVSKHDSTECAHVNLKYYSPDFQCFSDWTPEELKSFSQFCTKLRQMSWPEIYRTGGSLGNKTGLGYTPHKDITKLPAHPELDKLSEDLTWFELRLSEKVRVHGFRMVAAFFLVFLDREHAVHKM